jgi:hypothetical protein
MKNLFAFLMLFGIITQPLFAQKKAEWKEMKDFHTVMSKTFHPSEENNLKPLREMSKDLVSKAEAWKNSSAPEGYDAKLVSPILNKLLDKCKAIDKAIPAGASDSELKIMITEAHDVFHEIMEKCRPGVGDKH